MNTKPHKNGVGTLWPDLSLSDQVCFIGSCSPTPDRSAWRLSVVYVFPRPVLLCKVGATESGATDATRTNLKSTEFLALLQSKIPFTTRHESAEPI